MCVEVVLLLEFAVCCVGEVFVCLLLLLLCLFVMLFGFFVLVLEDYPHLHFVLCHFTAPVSIGATTSSAKKLPHRVVTLKSTDKGEEEMAF